MKTDQIRDVGKLNKTVGALLELALTDLKKQGVNPLVVETLRTKERQYYLYGQGRSEAQCKAKGVPAEYARGGLKVTSTLNSIHIEGCAVDCIPQRKVDGKTTAIWNASDKDTKKIIATMTKYGFEAGANWTSFKDSPHYQIALPKHKSQMISRTNTTYYLTKAIQKALGIKEDGLWGQGTTDAVNKFRKTKGWTKSGALGAKGMVELLSK